MAHIIIGGSDILDEKEHFTFDNEWVFEWGMGWFNGSSETDIAIRNDLDLIKAATKRLSKNGCRVGIILGHNGHNPKTK